MASDRSGRHLRGGPCPRHGRSINLIENSIKESALLSEWQGEYFVAIDDTVDGDRRPATGDRRPATGDRRPATGDRRPATGD
ncbi:hypothetical protein OG806_01480 [Streptomyces sp. NBC_00882]|uniref:hypothetical protein n=1 Tax=Streptomyces sp. NBC_00882 TaxID=2975856 RepID=UPI0038681E1B|nr:hypothetical protein OG806_01480 [Streptomyces sp. NBC_00882]